MIKVKEKYKGYNVPYKDKTLGTLQGDDLKKYIRAFLYSKKPNEILVYFDNTIGELTEFAESTPKKAIKKPTITPEITE